MSLRRASVASCGVCSFRSLHSHDRQPSSTHLPFSVTNREASPMEMPAMSYAGFWKRFLAYIIDTLVMGVVYTILLVPFFLVGGVVAAALLDSGCQRGES